MQTAVTFPYWQDVQLPEFRALDRDLTVDVVIVGGGMTGITAAYLLHNEGVRVALLERERFARADTGHTTAHLTYVTDYRLHELVKRFGREAARRFWRAGAIAIDQIENIVRQTGAECDFRRVPGFLHEAIRDQGEKPNDTRKEIELLRQDLELAREFGFDAGFVHQVDFLGGRAGLRFANQAKFHPRKYLKFLLRTLAADGVALFETTNFESVTEGASPVVHANGHRIRCEYLIFATHNPLTGLQGTLRAALLQTKLSLYTSYVLGARAPVDTVAEALFWDTADPYDYLRVDSYPDHQFLIFGGEDVKTGQEENVAACFDTLAQRLQALVPAASISHRWLGQVIETDDGLPFIGECAARQFIATGFCGNGFTLGTVGAMMARDRVLGRANEWSDLFRVDRKPFHGGVWRYVRENLDFPIHLIGDRLRGAEGSIEDVLRGEGKIVSYNGDKAAAYRNAAGELTLCSPVCTHMKCIVHWNDVDHTWDCPCHGSRFNPDGAVHSGPAEEPLARIDLPPDDSQRLHSDDNRAPN